MTRYRTRSPARPSRLVPACALVAAMTAHAAPEAANPAASAAAPAASAPLLTQAQVRECLARRDQLQSDGRDIAAQKVTLDKDRDELQAGIAAMQERAATVDRKKQADVDAYNNDSAERNRQIAAMSERITAFNAKAAAVMEAQDAYEKACVNKPYDPRHVLPDNPR